MARIVPLTKHKIAIVDDEDFPRVSQYKWYAHQGSRNQGWYAARTTSKLLGPRKIEWLHRFILQPGKDEQIDHRNGNGLDCRKANLRICTNGQNNQNRAARRDNESGFKGVCFNKRKWVAQIAANRKQITVGYFNTALEAARAYDKAARELHGEFAKTNFDD